MLIWGTGWSSVGHRQPIIAFCTASHISKISNLSMTNRQLEASRWSWFQICFVKALFIDCFLLLVVNFHCSINLARTIIAQLLLTHSMGLLGYTKIINLKGFYLMVYRDWPRLNNKSPDSPLILFMTLWGTVQQRARVTQVLRSAQYKQIMWMPCKLYSARHILTERHQVGHSLFGAGHTLHWARCHGPRALHRVDSARHWQYRWRGIVQTTQCKILF